MFSKIPPALRPGRNLCSFMIHGDIPCARRVDYVLSFNGEAGITHGRARSCYTHMMGYILCWQYANQELPAFHPRIMN